MGEQGVLLGVQTVVQVHTLAVMHRTVVLEVQTLPSDAWDRRSGGADPCMEIRGTTFCHLVKFPVVHNSFSELAQYFLRISATIPSLLALSVILWLSR